MTGGTKGEGLSEPNGTQRSRMPSGLGLDAQALYQLGVCYSKMNLEDEAQKIFEVILRNYQGSDVAKQAADLIPAAN